MALFDKFTKKDAPAIEPPASLSIDAQPGIGYAPVSGRVIRMTDVPDKVFSTEVLERGARSGPTATSSMPPPTAGSARSWATP